MNIRGENALDAKAFMPSVLVNHAVSGWNIGSLFQRGEWRRHETRCHRRFTDAAMGSGDQQPFHVLKLLLRRLRLKVPVAALGGTELAGQIYTGHAGEYRMEL